MKTLNDKRLKQMAKGYAKPEIHSFSTGNWNFANCSDMQSCSDTTQNCKTPADAYGPCSLFVGCNGECCWLFLGDDTRKK